MAVDPDAVFAAEWTLAADGVYERKSGRVAIVDPAGRVLLMRASEGDRTWWFTVGGGVADGEDERTAAAREAFEETGMRLDAGSLLGPIFRRVPTFTFLGRRCRQDEVTYLARVAATDVTTDGWTEVERAAMDGVTWWSLDELRTTGEIVYPSDLGDRVAAVVAHGWDGTTPVID